ncbi:hypothetical protein [Arthrobacter sp. Y-9]|uniref:hypothetical protein n=1 Tax=Arthrobacter sp. Y-9 TaxID=3039385 RepID=UPI00241CED38|nr:hypothetical protein [Arthrobacter sp. Y-9]WFR83102.1 hypothetical protein P9849_11095 [Arthrobacter sp. Y-9]
MPMNSPQTGALLSRPLSVTVVSLVALVEGLVLLVVAGIYVVNLLAGTPVLTFAGAVFLAVLFAALGLGLMAIGHFLFRGYRWPRSGALVAQLFILAIGIPTLQAGLIWQGLLIIIPAAVSAVLIFDPRAVAYGRWSTQAADDDESSAEQGATGEPSDGQPK